ncbi:hypothetical protein P3G55_08225 [Leptospira sp. 96542]|nr:hypothetical protein [Leptospira sp. 96542]
MHKFILCLFLIFFGFYDIHSIGTSGLYFSAKHQTENGFILIGIELFGEKGKTFYLSQELRFQKTRGWEEVLVEGSVQNDGKNLSLHPNQCQVRATDKWGQKMGLLRKFDCDHLEFQISQTDRGAILSESSFGTFKEVPLPVFLPGVALEPIAVQWDPIQFPEGVWGFHLNRLGGLDPIQVWNPKTSQWIPYSQRDSVQGPRFFRWKRTLF